MVVGTDAHYLTKEDRFVHKSYLNSKGGEREIDAFYEFTYVMTPAECHELLMKSFNDSDIVDSIFGATIALKTTFALVTMKLPTRTLLMLQRLQMPTSL